MSKDLSVAEGNALGFQPTMAEIASLSKPAEPEKAAKTKKKAKPDKADKPKKADKSGKPPEPEKSPMPERPRSAEEPASAEEPPPTEKAAKPKKDPKPQKGYKFGKGPETVGSPKPELLRKPEKSPTPGKSLRSGTQSKSLSEKPFKDETPKRPQKPPGKIMSMILLPIPFSRGGCCGDAIPFFLSCLLIAILGLLVSLANLSLILAYLMTYSSSIAYSPVSGTCVNPWWEADNPLFIFFYFPTMLLVLHVLLLVAYIACCVFLILSTVMRSAFLLRINVLLGTALIFPTIIVGLLEVFLMSREELIHWNAVLLFFFIMIFLYSTMIVHGYHNLLMSPPKSEKVQTLV